MDEDDRLIQFTFQVARHLERQMPDRGENGIYFNRDGSPMTTQEWIQRCCLGPDSYSRVHHTVVAKDAQVSTVWLGMEHGRDGQGRPLIFESMCFAPGTSLDEVPYRYATELEARQGHDEMVALLQAELDFRS